VGASSHTMLSLMVSESQLSHKIVNLLFTTTTNLNSKLTSAHFVRYGFGVSGGADVRPLGRRSSLKNKAPIADPAYRGATLMRSSLPPRTTVGP